MSAVSNWASPYQFNLTNPYNGVMALNVQTENGLYLLIDETCKYSINVRATKADIPQSNGSLLHQRFLSGAEILLSVQLWKDPSHPACDDLLQTMNDELTGALRSLLNAGDNAGRLAWELEAGGGVYRMLDDCRLLVYPSDDHAGGVTTVTATIDSRFPYALDLTPVFTPISDGATVVINNTGNSEMFPVFRVDGATSNFAIQNATTGEELLYDGVAIGGGDFAELNCFNNTIYLNGDGADLLAGINIPESLFPRLLPGNNSVTIVGADCTVEWNPSWA